MNACRTAMVSGTSPTRARFHRSISNGFSSLVPFFGSEKRNAPVESYVRISNEEIFEIGEIVYPNVLMIFSEQVITLGTVLISPGLEIMESQ